MEEKDFCVVVIYRQSLNETLCAIPVKKVVMEIAFFVD
jgi:hypothetical protein